MRQVILILTMAFLLLNVSQSQAQERADKKCKSEASKVNYEWAGFAPLLKVPNHVFGYLVIKPKNIKRDFMVQMAKRLKQEYCNAEKFQVIIFDNGKYANPYSMQDYVDSKGKIILMRGFYSFDRSTGEDKLEFSSNFGSPTTETMLDFSKVK